MELPDPDPGPGELLVAIDTASTVQETSNKATFRRFQDANTGDVEFISKTIDEIVEPDVKIRTLLPVEATGAQALKEVFARLHRAFPDLHHITVDAKEAGMPLPRALARLNRP
jgi:hypothetical protein